MLSLLTRIRFPENVLLGPLAGREAASTRSPRQVGARRPATVPGAASIHRGRASPGSARFGGSASERKPQFRCCRCPGASAGELGSWRPPKAHRGLFPHLPCRREPRCRTAVWGPLQGNVPTLSGHGTGPPACTRLVKVLQSLVTAPNPPWPLLPNNVKAEASRPLFEAPRHLAQAVVPIFYSESALEAFIQRFRETTMAQALFLCICPGSLSAKPPSHPPRLHAWRSQTAFRA